MSIPSIVFLSYFASLTPLFFRLVVTHISTTHTHMPFCARHGLRHRLHGWKLCHRVELWFVLWWSWKILGKSWKHERRNHLWVERLEGYWVTVLLQCEELVSDLLLISGGEAGHSNVTSGVQWGKSSEMDMTPPCGSNPQFWRYLKIHFFKVLRRCGSIIFYNIK